MAGRTKVVSWGPVGLVLLWSFAAGAQSAIPGAGSPVVSPADVLIVGTHPVPPFVIREGDGRWGGISMALWTLVAEELELRYEVRELPVAELIRGGPNNPADVVVSLNITAEREKLFDLTHAFYSTGLGIAVRKVFRIDPRPPGHVRQPRLRLGLEDRQSAPRTREPGHSRHHRHRRLARTRRRRARWQLARGHLSRWGVWVCASGDTERRLP